MKTNTILKQVGIIIGIIGIIFLFVSFFYPIPDRELPYNYKEYVGGDAYNMIIEASIRGGEIAGATTAKTIFMVTGLLLCATCGIIIYIDKQKNMEIFT